MKYSSKTRSTIRGLVAAGCALCAALPSTGTAAEVSEADFQALKEMVQKLAGQVQKLEQTHVADQQTHLQDQEAIQQLQMKIGQTQATAIEADRKASLPPPEPVFRVPTDEGSVNRNFLILGDAEFQYARTEGNHGAFLLADFAPIFLYRAGDRILFEAGFDFILQNNAPGGGGYTTTVNLSFAQLDYILNDYATVVAGNMLLPLGTYSERTAGWLNKFPDDPLPRDLLPGAGVGVQVRGAVPLAASGQILNYSVWGVNGPGSADGSGNAGALDLGGNVGLRSDNAVANLHGHPSGGARVGWFIPFKPKFDLELGISGQSGEWDNAGTHLWSAGVLDASLHLGPSIELKGEYVRSRYGSDDSGNVHPQGVWVQAGYKLAGLDLNLPIINNLELVGRFDASHDGLGIRTHRFSTGFVYYLTNALLLEGDYEFLHGNDPAAQGSNLIFQISYGF